jgi:hypothetical protein
LFSKRKLHISGEEENVNGAKIRTDGLTKGAEILPSSGVTISAATYIVTIKIFDADIQREYDGKNELFV